MGENEEGIEGDQCVSAPLWAPGLFDLDLHPCFRVAVYGEYWYKWDNHIACSKEEAFKSGHPRGAKEVFVTGAGRLREREYRVCMGFL